MSFSLLKNHFIGNLPDLFDLDLDSISILQPHWGLQKGSHATGCSGHDHCPFSQRRPSAQVADDVFDAEYQVVCPAILSQAAVDPGPEPQCFSVTNGF